jgi:hypothetical protein
MPNSRAPGIQTAVITGGHAFDVVNFHRLFRSLEGVDAYVQHTDDFASSPQAMRDSYDVALFYSMLTEGPHDEGQPGHSGKPKTALEHLGETTQGIVLLHHAILAYPDWPQWGQIVGIQNRELSAYYHDQMLRVEIANAHHPITEDLSAWEMVDEAYTMANAEGDSDILLTVDHPQSMKTIAWTRRYKNARVFCYVLGHDNHAWGDPNFRTVLTRGIQWAAGKL